MSSTLQHRLSFDSSTASIQLTGDVTDEAVPTLRSLADRLTALHIRRVVFDLRDVGAVSAVAMRYLAFLQQQLRVGIDYVVVEPPKAVRDAMALAGLGDSVMVADAA